MIGRDTKGFNTLRLRDKVDIRKNTADVMDINRDIAWLYIFVGLNDPNIVEI